MATLISKPSFPGRPLGIAAALLCMIGAAQAQSLAELYDAARGYDAAYLSVRSQAESTLYKAEQARAANRPAVNLTAGATAVNSNTPYTATKNTHSLTEQTALNLTQALFNRGNDITITQAERGIAIAYTLRLAAEQDLIVRLAQAYFDVLAARDALATTQANKTAIAEQLASAKRNFEVGTATITDTREAQARFDQASAQEIAADNDLRVKRLFLDQLVGRDGIEPKGLAQPVILPAPQPSDVGAWLSFSAEAPSVQKSQLDFDVASLDIDKAKAANLPTVNLAGNVSGTHSSVNGNSAGAAGSSPFSLSGIGTGTSIGVSLSMPIWSGNLIDSRIKETVALREKARSDLDAAKRKSAQDTRSAFFGVSSGLAQVKALEAAESSSKLALEATQLGYKVGVRVNLDVLNAQTQVFQTQRDLAKARYDVIVNGLKLRQASGQLSPQDVATTSTLLSR